VVNFLIVYGGGAKALWEQTGIPLDEAAAIINTWRERYSSISALAKYLGLEREALRTISNRRLPVTRVKGNGPNAGDIRAYANINYAVQSAAREVLVDAWIRLEDGHSRPGIVWLPVHDELVLQVPDDEIDAVIADAEHSMRMEFRGVPVEADAIVLRDENGVSRWMTGKRAEAIAKEAAA
jgi:DNA polymerase-1